MKICGDQHPTRPVLCNLPPGHEGAHMYFGDTGTDAWALGLGLPNAAQGGVMVDALDRAHAEVAAADAEAALAQGRAADWQKRAEDAEDKVDEYMEHIVRHEGILTDIVTELRGDPAPLTTWSMHEAPGLAVQMRERAEKAEAALTRVRALIPKWNAEGDYATWACEEGCCGEPHAGDLLAALDDTP